MDKYLSPVSGRITTNISSIASLLNTSGKKPAVATAHVGFAIGTGRAMGTTCHGDGDVIVAAGNLPRKEVVDMGREFYTNISIIAVWFVKYIFIPIGVAVITKIITDKLLQPQPGRQRKKRSYKNRLK